MNWYMVFRIIIKIILIIILISITFFQWLKFSEENTSISVSYAAQRNLELPALTICPLEYKGENEIQGENLTFKEYYMKGVLNISDLFIEASQNSYLPGKK